MAVRILDSIVSTAMLLIFLLLLSIGIYALWDSNQITQAADVSQYAAYKPTAEDSLSFEELRALNAEVFGWLTVYGTNIDYPLLQADNNEKYVNTDVYGEYSLSGALFLDYRNNTGFTDFNSIIYGHHMAASAMFGDIQNFRNKDYFVNHQYGQLYTNGNIYGIEFFAFIETDAYDRSIYSLAISEDHRQEYLDYIFSKADLTRDMNISIHNNIVLLSTCSNILTNGRHILLGVITDEIYENPFQEKTENKTEKLAIGETLVQILIRYPVGFLIVVIITLLIITNILKSKKAEQ